jgi:hypothetical protein
MARRRTRAWVTAVAIASLALGLVGVGDGGRPAAAQAQRAPHAKPLAQSLTGGAKRDYDAGKMLFDDGDYATALLKYQAAYDATHDVRLLWDVAVCEKSLRHYATTLATLARYQAEGGDLLTPGDRHDAQELSRAIAPFTSAQTVNVSEDGAEVWIDGQLVGRSPLPAPVVLDLGTRHVRIVKDGFRPWSRDMPVGGSASTAVAALLEKQAGHLDLTLPAEAIVAIDGREASHGPTLSVDLPSGPHALRVSAPNLRPIVTDVIIEDGKSRALDLKLEPEAAPSSEVHVTVGCGRPEPLPQDDLSVFFDDATVSALPLGVRMRREPGREVIAYIAYRVAPGRHTVHVAALGCTARDAVVDAPEGGVANVTGALPPSDDWYEGSPAGSHDGWRLSAGIIETSASFGDYENFFLPHLTKPNETVGLTLIGASVATGYEGRWVTGLVEGRFEGGRVSDIGGTSAYNQLHAVPVDHRRPTGAAPAALHRGALGGHRASRGPVLLLSRRRQLDLRRARQRLGLGRRRRATVLRVGLPGGRRVERVRLHGEQGLAERLHHVLLGARHVHSEQRVHAQAGRAASHRGQRELRGRREASHPAREPLHAIRRLPTRPGNHSFEPGKLDTRPGNHSGRPPSRQIDLTNISSSVGEPPRGVISAIHAGDLRTTALRPRNAASAWAPTTMGSHVTSTIRYGARASMPAKSRSRSTR